MDRRASSLSGSAITKIVTLLVVVCLVECATEQRINSRGSKPSNIIERVNGWRSQRGGSCLSYGHSCWGAHGKRSGKPPGTDPNLWYLARILRSMAANSEMNRDKLLATQTKNEGMDAIYPVNIPATLVAPRKPTENNDDEGPIELPLSGNMEGKPMLDDNTISNIKLWQIMRGTSEDN